MNTTLTTTCPLCKTEGVIIHEGTRDNADINVYECPACKIKFLSLFKEGNYEEGYMYETDEICGISFEDEMKQCRESDERRFQMMKEKCADKKILDFGCGFGGFLSKIQNYCKYCAGVELSKTEMDFVNNMGIRCERDIEHFEKEEFDIITLFHVLEHFEDPTYWIKKVAEYLKPGGELVLEVPNADDALLSIYDNPAFADFTYWSAHLILFNEKALCDLMSSTELFTPVSIGFYQRFPISNHLMWLAKGVPGGQDKWTIFNVPELQKAYENVLIENKACDTLLQTWQKRY